MPIVGFGPSCSTSVFHTAASTPAYFFRSCFTFRWKPGEATISRGSHGIGEPCLPTCFLNLPAECRAQSKGQRLGEIIQLVQGRSQPLLDVVFPVGGDQAVRPEESGARADDRAQTVARVGKPPQQPL